MSAVVLAAGVLALALPHLLRGWGRSLAPSEWARTVRACLLLGVAALGVGLVSVVAPVVLQVSGAHDAADVCHRLLGPSVLGGELGGLLAGVTALLVARRAVVGAWDLGRQQRALRVEPWLGHHERTGHVDVVVLPTSELLAYAVPGPLDQVVLSEGMVDVLDDDELRAVVAHERSHLARRHLRDLALAAVCRAALGWLPWVRRSCDELRLAVERSADEDASDDAGQRAALARALTKAVHLDPPALLAVNGHHEVEARLTALTEAGSAPPRGPRVATVASPGLLGASLVLAMVAASLVSHHGAWSLVGLCPMWH